MRLTSPSLSLSVLHAPYPHSLFFSLSLSFFLFFFFLDMVVLLRREKANFDDKAKHFANQDLNDFTSGFFENM